MCKQRVPLVAGKLSVNLCTEIDEIELPADREPAARRNYR